MRKFLSVLMAILLTFGILSSSHVSAASKTYYYVVGGTSTTKPGIYKSTVNGTAKAVMTEKVYKTKKLSKAPVKLDASHFYYSFYGNGSIAKKSDYKNPYNVITYPILEVQAKGNDLYYTKVLYRAEEFCGYVVDILEIYKRNSKGKVTKVVTDQVTTNITDQFFVKDKYIYYAKLKKNLINNFDIVRTTLDGKQKTVLKKSVDDFWVKGKYIYYIKNGALYRMNMNAKNSKKYSNLKVKLFSNGCGGENYVVTGKGLVIESAQNGKIIFLNFSTGKTVNIDGSIYNIVDVDLNKKRYIEIDQDFENNKEIVSIYNLNGKLIKKHKATISYVISADAAKGEMIYVSGKKLKKIKF